MGKSTKTGAISYSRAAIQPASFNKEARTFDVVFATETPVFRNPWYADEAFNEVLSCVPDNVRMERAAGGLPLFNNHRTYEGVLIQYGKVDNIRFEEKQMVGTVTLGARADEAMISDIENGIISGVSVGYNVYSYERQPMSKDQKIPVYRATDWEPIEVSLAPVQADVNSKIRSVEEHEIDIINPLKNSKMDEIEEIRKDATDDQKKRLDDILSITRTAKMDDAKAVELYKSEKTVDEIRAVVNPDETKTPPATPAPAPQEQRSEETPKPEETPVNINKIRSEASTEEKKRLNDILLSTRAARLEDARAVEYYLSDKPVEEIRQLIIDEFVKGDIKVIATDRQAAAIDKKREAIEEAILQRAAPYAFKPKAGEVNEYRHMTLMEIGKEMLRERGVNFNGRSKTEIAGLIIAGTRDLATSDFPLLLENAANKMLRQDYGLAPEYWQRIARQTSVSDFREKGFYQVGSSNGMKEIPEGDELKYGKMTEAKQTIRVKSYGEGLKFTRQMIINDDLSAFERIPQKFVRDWDLQRGDLVWGMITNNVKMADGKLLFSTDHANLSLNPASIGEDSLTEALVAFKSQTDIDGKTRIRVLPKYVIVSPEQEIAARKLLTAVMATKTGDVNVFATMGFELIVESRLAGGAWYLAADPNAIDGLYYANLDGQDGLRSNREDNFDTDSIKLGVRGDFGVAAIDYRGWYKNAGA
ncbi:MAG: hypothetical protein LBQ74_14060 [Prevotella sp.]|jgi:phage major head subunit gpT-like protein|nr:hypothetical protein [Prevotella sp.]